MTVTINISSSDSEASPATKPTPKVQAKDDSALSRPHPLLKKKSGELVKSSLRLSSLTKCASASSLLSPTKSVRFASRLANIKMFDGTDSPSVVSTTENSPTGTPPAAEGGDSYFDLRWDDDESDSNSVSDEEGVITPPGPTKYKWDWSNFRSVTNLHCTDGTPIYLSTLSLSADSTSLNGMLMAKNIAFEKAISIKLTFDGWQSKLIINNVSYVRSFAAINYDQFRFSIPLQNLASVVNVEFVIRYEVANQSFWDNNLQRNYKLKLVKQRPQPNRFNYNFPSQSLPQFDELVTKLNSYQTEAKANLDDGNYTYSKSSPSKTRSDFHSRYDFNTELSKPRDSKKSSASDKIPAPAFQSYSSLMPIRPPLKHSFSSSDIPEKPKYSQSYKARQNASAPKSTNSQEEPTKFNSQSYANLLEKYCFFGGDEQPQTSPLTAPLGGSKIDSPASTFHLLSDSIHI
ncbi:Protein phosphatase 1 regulatory subunit [Meyerozyma sp. JA9]|nr:Protein phosphatase 1 regulatory subunit [Meyerozyma sp. JA9]